MRRFYGILSVIIVFSMLCSCGSTGASVSSAISPASSAKPSGTSSPAASPSPSPSIKPSPDINVERKTFFREFLSDNYQKLSDDFPGGISGIGFIDLDLDGGMEMIIFDAGASAAMGAQFFDIVGGKVECVSANMDAIGKDFGGSHISKVAVNANYFDDFRLMKDKSTGKKFFVVKSGNGAADFSYSELVKFGSNNGILTLESLMYKYDNTDTDTGKVTSSSYKVGGKSASAADYNAADKAFSSANEDTGFTAKGAFVWSGEYGSGQAGLLAMADEALSEYSDISAS